MFEVSFFNVFNSIVPIKIQLNNFFNNEMNKKILC